MELRQLRYFLAIANEGQVTRAAQVLNMAQPPLSQSLKSLEDELGVILFERNGRRMLPTQAGELLRTRAETIIHLVNETAQEMKELHEGVSGVLRIGSARSCSPFLPARIQQFRRAYPRMKFRLWEGDPNGLTQRIEKREIDLGLIRLPLETDYDPGMFTIRKLKEEPFVAVLPPEWDPDPSAIGIRLSDLSDKPFILLQSEKSTGTYDIVTGACEALGFTPNVVCECSSISSILAMVREGLGVTVLHEASVADQPHSLHIKRLTDAPIQSEVALIHLKDRILPRSVQLFIETFQDMTNL
ncbi:LysR family transcriptional regulator [Paenibacillus sp. LHD-117]|uniref:LysR family transcriptional regulator n=1 Tax=Paenibacillus sp. LHD-117 TaxID=3071412 RepID=UPI0027E01C24|nr:LysR family transcriptional regulator [Paenibacillus sp. LHD-117]MDQ6422022.1 LysR family transcriptional regulator [Paenibacillus sp. LHD-117]